MSGPQVEGTGYWTAANNELACAVLREAGLSREGDIQTAIAALTAAGLLVSTRHWVPTSDDLYGMYRRLVDAYLHGRIKVRWVMCAETHDELARRYRDQRYPVMEDLATWIFAEADPVDQISDRVRIVMEANRHWGDTSMLFGIPIRIDPAARRPMFEIVDDALSEQL